MLLVRLDSIGDALALTPLLAAFSLAGIPVDVVLRDVNRDALSTGAARRRLVAPFALRSGTPENRDTIGAFADSLRATGYTHTLVATEDAGGYLLARAVASKARIGFSNGWGKPFKTLWIKTLLTHTLYRPAGLDPNAPHECDVLFELGRTLLGNAKPSRDPRVLRPIVLEREVATDGRLVVQISDKWERLGIARDDVVRLLQLAARSGSVRAVSSQAEREYAERVATASGIAVEIFDNVRDWKEAIAAASAVIAPDSGALHVAGMVGTPTVAVFPVTASFGLQTARWKPWAAPSRIIDASERWPERAIDALAELLNAPTHLAR